MQIFLTMGEIVFYHFALASKQQSNHASSSLPKSVPSARKIMASVVWDADYYGRLFSKGAEDNYLKIISMHNF